MDLNTDQAAAFEAVKSGKNLFLTGPAGSGKSYLIRRIVEWAEDTKKTLHVTALTGCAALLLGNKAKTLHSWAGIGLGRGSADMLATAIAKNPHAKRRWKRTEILIVDEVSMMTPELFEKLDAIGKRIRTSLKPWGGIQLIVCGDYFQLPPVMKGISGEGSPGRFAFESPAWTAAMLQPVVLTKIERQTDLAFQQLLNECRIGEPSAKTIELLKSRQNLDWKSRMIRPTLLFSRNADVDAINEKNIAALKKPLKVFDAITSIVRNPDFPDIPMPTGEELETIVSKLDNDANYAPHLELCLGAQVMLLINRDIEARLVNGSRGVIVDFSDDGFPMVQFLHGDPIKIGYNDYESNTCPHVTRQQVPLRVAYAVTIHKSQGATLDCALVDIGNSTFEFGQAYVALSRVRDLESLYIHNLVPSKIKAHPAVVDFYMHLMDMPAPVRPAAVPPPSDFGIDLVDEGWRGIVTTWAASATGATCLAAVAERSSETIVYPPPQDVLNALRVTPLSKVKVVILGQDPYHGPAQAHGLSFSVKSGVLQPSLRNIRRELLSDLSLPETAWPLNYGNLTGWASQGVLLLNAVLTVEEGKPDSHAGLGWEDLTQRLLGAVISAHTDDILVFVAWGKRAQSIVRKLKIGEKHAIIEGVHPSPLSASTGFFGSKPFSKINALLSAAGAAPINWALTAPAVAGVGIMTEDPI